MCLLSAYQCTWCPHTKILISKLEKATLCCHFGGFEVLRAHFVQNLWIFEIWTFLLFFAGLSIAKIQWRARKMTSKRGSWGQNECRIGGTCNWTIFWTHLVVFEKYKILILECGHQAQKPYWKFLKFAKHGLHCRVPDVRRIGSIVRKNSIFRISD